MGRKTTVDQLPPEQRDFVIQLCTEHKTDRFISSAFEEEFGASLPKSSLNYWRQTTGNELVERYGIQRMLVKSFVTELEAKGVDVKNDRYAQLIGDLEEHLLAKTADLVAKDPMKLLAVRQEDERLRIKREQIGLNQQKLDFEKQKHEADADARTDRLKIGADLWQFWLYWLNEHEPHLAEGMTRCSAEFLPAMEGFLTNEAA
jgi:hypothetical protein